MEKFILQHEGGTWIPGWTFQEIGYIEECVECAGKPLIPDPRSLEPIEEKSVYHSLKSTQKCEECGVFVGRWITCMFTKVWCKKCRR